MINLYVKFIVHCRLHAEEVMLKVADRRAKGRTGGDNNRHPPKFWLGPKKPRRNYTGKYKLTSFEFDGEQHSRGILNVP